jgi:hypothetical protein
MDACVADYPGGVDDFNATATCINTHCGEWCDIPIV